MMYIKSKVFELLQKLQRELLESGRFEEGVTLGMFLEDDVDDVKYEAPQNPLANYTTPYTDTPIDVQAFHVACVSGGFTDYDGYGHPAKEHLMDKTIFVIPSRRHVTIPGDATHIVWYNR